MDLKFVKISSPGKSSYAFVTFKDEEAKKEAFEKLNNYKYKGKNLQIVVNLT